MTQGKHEAHASYTLRADPEEETMPGFRGPPMNTSVRVFMIATGIAVAGLIVAVVLMAAGLMHANTVNAGQAAQIRSLNQANSRMASAQSQMNAALNGQNPAADTNLITCSDFRHLDLTVTTGGSVSSVPGSVSLSQSPVRVPPHCGKR